MDSKLSLVREEKIALRRAIRERLATLTDGMGRSDRLCAAVACSKEWAASACVGLFAPMSHEPAIELLWSHAAGKTLVFPAIRGERLEFAAVQEIAALVPGAKGIREPHVDAVVVPVQRIDLLLVPGAAFTSAGDRLGRGGGFYDRLLAASSFRAFTMGVGFDVQLVPALPVEPHDRRLDAIATESGIQRVR